MMMLMWRISGKEEFRCILRYLMERTEGMETASKYIFRLHASAVIFRVKRVLPRKTIASHLLGFRRNVQK